MSIRLLGIFKMSSLVTPLVNINSWSVFVVVIILCHYTEFFTETKDVCLSEEISKREQKTKDVSLVSTQPLDQKQSNIFKVFPDCKFWAFTSLKISGLAVCT